MLSDGTRRADNPLHTNSPSPGHGPLYVVSRQGADAKGAPLYTHAGSHGVVVNGKSSVKHSAEGGHTDPMPLDSSRPKRGSMVSDSGETDEPAGSDVSDDFDARQMGGGERDDDVAALPGDSVGPPGGAHAPATGSHAKYQYYVRSPRKSLTPGARLHQA